MGACRECSIVTVKFPKLYSLPSSTTTIWSSGTPAPRAMFAVVEEPSTDALLRLAIAPTSIAWSKWECTGMMAASLRIPYRSMT